MRSQSQDLYDLFREQGTLPGNQLFREVSEEDPRFEKYKNHKLSSSTLGQLGQVLDSVFNPLREQSLLFKIYGGFLGCETDRIVVMTKKFASYRSPLIRFALMKMKEYKFQKLRIEGEKGEDGPTLDGGDKDLEVIQTGPDSSAKIPTKFNYGVIDNKGRKFCFSTSSSWAGFFLNFSYNGDKAGSEKVIDDFLEALTKTVDEHNYFKGGRINPKGEFLKISKLTWDDIELPEGIKKQIQDNIVNLIEKEEVYEKNGISSKRGLLFAGRPGTGKTMVCKILASELKGFTFIWVTANDLRQPEDVEGVYNMARELAPTIVLLEDADLFCGDRNFGSTQPVLGEILSQLDGLVELRKVVTIMTSNQPGILDKALIGRPGRFDIQIAFNPPETDSREKILTKALSKVHVKKSDIKEIAEQSKDLTGAQLREITNLAIIYAINEDSLDAKQIAKVEKAHLMQALDSYKSSAVDPISVAPVPNRPIAPVAGDSGEVKSEAPTTSIRSSYLEHREEPLIEESPPTRTVPSAILGVVNKMVSE